MKASAAQKWLVFLILTGLALFIGFYFYRYLNDQYQTETTYPYTVAETVRVSGIVLREEFLLEDKIVEDGVASYIVGDGTKVSKDSLIAEVYYSESDAGNVQKLRELENRRLLLEKAQDPGTTSYAHTDVLNKQIASEVGAIIDAVQSDNLTGLSGSSDNLLVLMNTKQIATGKQENYHDAIELIEAEEAYFQGQIQEEPETISSPKQGYFMRTIDGLENMVDLKELDELTPEDIRHLTSRPSLETPSDRVGKLMTDHNWYYAVIIESQDADRYREGSSVTLDFNISGVSPVPATIEEVNPSGGAPETVVVFRCDYINEALINLRVTEADVSFKSITGLRVSKSAVRFSGIQKGVYINMGEKRIFRPITVIYEDVGYVLCREVDPEYYENGTYVGLQQYDEVIIEGGTNAMEQTKTIQEILNRIHDNIAETCTQCGRSSSDVRLMAVTKTVPPERVNEAIACGVTLLGENKAQELCAKYDAYQKEHVEIHFIGHLQTNKVRQIIDKVTMIQSLDSIPLAKEIQRQCEKHNREMDCLVEVNIGNELTKSGVSTDELDDFLAQAACFDRLHLRGMMVIPPIFTSDLEKERCFADLQKLFIDIRAKKIDNISMDFLSMGMSDDYLLALKHGSNLIRLGSVIFGRRNYN